MNPQIKTALIMHDFFVEDLKLEYAIIGGIALQFWGSRGLPTRLRSLSRTDWISTI